MAQKEIATETVAKEFFLAHLSGKENDFNKKVPIWPGRLIKKEFAITITVS